MMIMCVRGLRWLESLLSRYLADSLNMKRKENCSVYADLCLLAGAF